MDEVRFTEDDVRFIVETVADRRQDRDHVVRLLLDKADLVEPLLDDERLLRRILEDEEVLVRISPRLLFTILLRRVQRDLRDRPYTMERVGMTETVPVFDASRVSQVLEDRKVLDYLTDLLASFTRVNTWTLVHRRGSRLVRRRFCDLSLEDMVELAGLVEEAARFPVYRRIADIALFTSGVFPEYAGGALSISRRGMAGMVPRGRVASLEEYEEEGRRFYRLASERPEAREARLDRVLGFLAEEFPLARKPLTILSHQYIRWTTARWSRTSAPS
ncbi:MAG: hypothetical protein HY660_18020 [Armatimonadetes bacterium]|nr:hypothetical protein [Armatimonadota bacterium]